MSANSPARVHFRFHTRAYEAGCNGDVTKPYRPRQLLVSIRQKLGEA